MAGTDQDAQDPRPETETVVEPSPPSGEGSKTESTPAPKPSTQDADDQNERKKFWRRTIIVTLGSFLLGIFATFLTQRFVDVPRLKVHTTSAQLFINDNAIVTERIDRIPGLDQIIKAYPNEACTAVLPLDDTDPIKTIANHFSAGMGPSDYCEKFHDFDRTKDKLTSLSLTANSINALSDLAKQLSTEIERCAEDLTIADDGRYRSLIAAQKQARDAMEQATTERQQAELAQSQTNADVHASDTERTNAANKVTQLGEAEQRAWDTLDNARRAVEAIRDSCPLIFVDYYSNDTNPDEEIKKLQTRLSELRKFSYDEFSKNMSVLKDELRTNNTHVRVEMWVRNHGSATGSLRTAGLVEISVSNGIPALIKLAQREPTNVEVAPGQAKKFVYLSKPVTAFDQNIRDRIDGYAHDNNSNCTMFVMDIDGNIIESDNGVLFDSIIEHDRDYSELESYASKTRWFGRRRHR